MACATARLGLLDVHAASAPPSNHRARHFSGRGLRCFVWHRFLSLPAATL